MPKDEVIPNFPKRNKIITIEFNSERKAILLILAFLMNLETLKKKLILELSNTLRNKRSSYACNSA